MVGSILAIRAYGADSRAPVLTQNLGLVADACDSRGAGWK